MSFSTIILLLLFLGISMYSKAKKTLVVQDIPADAPADDMQDIADDFFSEDPVEETESPYFTYEAETVAAPTYEKPKVNPQPVFVAAAEEPVRPMFDLRQAVIGQVILSNNYISELNQQNQ